MLNLKPKSIELKSVTLLFSLIFGVSLLLSVESDARRRRRDTFANQRLASINSEFHLLESPSIIRIVRQVSEKKAEEEEEEERENEEAAIRAAAAAAVEAVAAAANNAPTVINSTVLKTTAANVINVTTQVLAGIPTLGTILEPSTSKPSPPPSLPIPTPPVNQGELYLPPGYNHLEIPKLKIWGRVLPVPVIVYLNIRSIQDYDELEEHITLEMDLIVEWLDGSLFDFEKVNTKLALIQKTLNPVFLKKIWTPDIYMDNLISVEQPKFMAKPLSLKFSPNTGFISYTSRIAVKANCDMFFHYYPADTQTCEFQLKSYSFYSSDLELDWLRHGVYLQDPAEPNFDIQVVSIEKISTVQPFNNPKNETHDTLVFTILARRRLSFHLVQTYLPSIFFIIITWLCFLIPSKYIEARIGISMTTLLTLTAMFASVRESTPIVSYVKAIDLWMVFCIFFVFLTLLEFSILIWMRSIRDDALEKQSSIEDKLEEGVAGRRKGIPDTLSRHSTTSSTLRAHGIFYELVEKYAFVIFSLIFIIFNVIYWTWLLQAAKYFDWDVNANHTFIDDDE